MCLTDTRQQLAVSQQDLGIVHFAHYQVPDCICTCTGYFKAISKIVRQERAKLYIPVSAPTTAIFDSLTQDVLPKDCVCWTLPPHLTGLLDDKTAFTDLCNKVSRVMICNSG